MARSSRSPSPDSAISPTIANDPLLSAYLAPVRPAPAVYDLSYLEDRRLFHPEGEHALPTFFTGLVERNVRARISKARYDLYQRPFDRPEKLRRAVLSFRDPSRVLVCVRRQARREVLFALSPHRKIGSGAGKHRRRTWLSAISC